jgi:hypothetical protein
MKVSCTLTALLLCAMRVSFWAQTTSVSGGVTDPTGAVVSGTVVRLTDTATRQALTTTTNGAGRYFFSSLTPGAYGMTFSKMGFSTRRIDNQHVDVGLGLTINAVLELGSVSTVVEVRSPAGAELQTMNSTVRNVVSGDSLMLLPNTGRDAATFAILQPAVSPEGANAGAGYARTSGIHHQSASMSLVMPDCLMRSQDCAKEARSSGWITVCQPRSIAASKSSPVYSRQPRLTKSLRPSSCVVQTKPGSASTTPLKSTFIPATPTSKQTLMIRQA